MSASLASSPHLIDYVPFLLVAGAIALVAIQVYTALTSPLNSIPGPLIAKFTCLKLKERALSGEKHRYVHALHEKYGPIVRVAPNEVDVADVDAARQVYKVGGNFYKTKWYYDFTYNGTNIRSVFSETDPKNHGHHRSLVSTFFSEKYIAKLEPDIVKNVKLAIQRIREDVDRQGYADVFKWYFMMATDVVGEAAFGKSFEMLQTGKKTQYIMDLERIGKSGVYNAELPLLFQFVRKIPFGLPKQISKCAIRLKTSGQASVDRYWNQLKADPENVKPTLLTKEYGMVEQGIFPKQQLTVDATGYLVAGTDTTSNTLSYATWELMHHPEVEQALVAEIADLPEDFMDEDLRKLKVLEGILNESLRLHSAVSVALPRRVPNEGAEFCGHFLPPGTTVGIQAHTMHRKAHVFPDPEEFRPSRWENPTKEMKEHFLPFGGGSRVCIGMHFSKLEMRRTIVELYRTFPGGLKPSKAENFNEADMVSKSYFLEGPKSQRVLVERR